jgi:hypothetical protein
VPADFDSQFKLINKKDFTISQGSATGDISTLFLGGKLYQTSRGGDDPTSIWIRTTSDGQFDNLVNSKLAPVDSNEAWSQYITDEAWKTEGSTGTGQITTIEFNSKIYQFIRGQDNPLNIFMRVTSDGFFDLSTEDEKWKLQTGQSTVDLEGVVHNNKIYLALIGQSGNVYTKTISTTGTQSNWQTESPNAKFSNSITMASVGSQLYQFGRGEGDPTVMWFRYTADGNFDLKDPLGTSAANENWQKINEGRTNSNISNLLNGNNLRQFIVGGDSKKIFYRDLNTQNLVTEIQSKKWLEYPTDNLGFTADVQGYIFKNKTVLSSKALLAGNENIYVKTENLNWTNYPDANSQSDITMYSWNGVLYQYITGRSGAVYWRKSSDGIFDAKLSN